MNPTTATTHQNEFLMLTKSTDNPAEWDAMWNALRAHWKGDFADYNAAVSECWQYVGTTRLDGRWEHVFRHRLHPRTGKREYFRVKASPAFESAHPLRELRPYERLLPAFDPADCSGAFDGISVTSDADSGL